MNNHRRPSARYLPLCTTAGQCSVRESARRGIPPDAGPGRDMDHPTYLILARPSERRPVSVRLSALRCWSARPLAGDQGLAGAVKTERPRGVHVLVPVSHRVTRSGGRAPGLIKKKTQPTPGAA